VELSEISGMQVEETTTFKEESPLRESPLRSPSLSAKRRKIDTNARTEFDLELKKLDEWFDKTESTLDLLLNAEWTGPAASSSSSQEQFTEEEQLVLVQVSGGYTLQTSSSAIQAPYRLCLT
jgi:hypothetical protein